MRVLYLDTFSGISGDMTIGALLDAGVPWSVLEQGLAPLRLSGYRLERDQRTRAGITATKLHVHLDGDEYAPLPGAGQKAHDHESTTAHAQGPGAEHAHPHGHAEHTPPHATNDPSEAHGHAHQTEYPHRHYREIRALLDRAALPPRAKARAQQIFRALAGAEGRVHGVAPEDVAFHEVGAIDAIVDVVGTALCLEHLEIDLVYCAPLPLGSGFARSAHGVIPVPPPAVVELLRGFPVRAEDGAAELVTPTGAAIVAALATPGRPPQMIVRAVGYGAGDRELADRPNLLRVIIGEIEDAATRAAGNTVTTRASVPSSAFESDAVLRTDGNVQLEEMIVLEANIDDMSPELYEPAVEALFEAGARDVTLSPLAMKKGRPGTLVQVIAEPGDRERLGTILLRETTTIGVRSHPVSRLTLRRTQRTVETIYGPVLVKVVTLPDGGERAAPEYEDCRRVARTRGVSVGTVFAAAQQASTAAK